MMNNVNSNLSAYRTLSALSIFALTWWCVSFRLVRLSREYVQRRAEK